MPTNTPFDSQQLYVPSKEEEEEFKGILSSWMDLKTMREKIQAIEERAKWSVQTAPQFKIIREARQAADFAKYLQDKGRQVEVLRMNVGPSAWPDFWMYMNGEELPCELTAMHNPDQEEMCIPIHRDDEGNLILDANTDYSGWPEDQVLRAIPHAGHWKGQVARALRSGQELPLGAWPQGDIKNYLPMWVEEAVRKKNRVAEKGNYAEGTVLVVTAEFEIKFYIPQELIKRLHAAMKCGSMFRAVFLHVPNSMGAVWPNPAFPPFAW